MHKILAVIKVLFKTTIRKYPGFFILKIIRMAVSIVMPFIAVFISPMIVDEIVGARDIKKLIVLAAVLIGSEAVCQIINDMCNNFINRYSNRIDKYFSILIGRHVMELDFQLTEDKEALEQIEKARTGMEWYSGGVHGISDQFFYFFGNLFKAIGFITVIALKAPVLLLVMVIYTFLNALFVLKINN
ncbi:MAG: hypothetical protein K6G81_00485 [Lachnospiraceae bacterium]|nr:hypothetical protein [Lachnospiraceae bacterium]